MGLIDTPRLTCVRPKSPGGTNARNGVLQTCYLNAHQGMVDIRLNFQRNKDLTQLSVRHPHYLRSVGMSVGGYVRPVRFVELYDGSSHLKIGSDGKPASNCHAADRVHNGFPIRKDNGLSKYCGDKLAESRRGGIGLVDPSTIQSQASDDRVIFDLDWSRWRSNRRDGVSPTTT